MTSRFMKWLENRERSLLAAGGLTLAVVLLLAALGLILGRNRIGKATAAVGLVLLASAYIAAAVLVAMLGTTEKPDAASSHGPPTQSLSKSQGPWFDRPYRISATANPTGNSGDNPL